MASEITGTALSTQQTIAAETTETTTSLNLNNTNGATPAESSASTLADAQDRMAAEAQVAQIRVERRGNWAMQRARELAVMRAGHRAGTAEAIAEWEAQMKAVDSAATPVEAELVDTGAPTEGAAAVVEKVMQHSDEALEEIADDYAAKFAQADALEASYRAGEGGTGLLREAARIRAKAVTELRFLGVNTAVITGGSAAIRQGLQVAEIERRFGDARPVGIAVSLTTRANEQSSALMGLSNDMSRIEETIAKDQDRMLDRRLNKTQAPPPDAASEIL